MLLSSHSGTQLLVTTVRACGHRPTTASVYQALQLFDHHLPLLSPLLLQDPHPPKTASSLRARVTTRQCQVIPAKRLWTSTALSPILNSAAGTLQSAQTVLVCGLVTTTVLASQEHRPSSRPRQPLSLQDVLLQFLRQHNLAQFVHVRSGIKSSPGILAPQLKSCIVSLPRTLTSGIHKLVVIARLCG
jgi:hypothetical protein